MLSNCGSQLSPVRSLARSVSNASQTPGRRVAGGRFDAAIQSLRSLSKDMKASQAKEPEDYHWLIVGDLALAIAALLETFGV